MSQADELLNNLTENDISQYTAEPEIEPHIVIDSNRFISVPESLRRIAVQYDNNVETITFDCPRYWDGIDMYGMRIFINYSLENNYKDMYYVDNIRIDEENPDIMHFEWTISRNVTSVKGRVAFLVCIHKVDSDGIEINHWNSEINREMYVSDGLEPEEFILKKNSDVITTILDRLENAESLINESTSELVYLKYTIREHNDSINSLTSKCKDLKDMQSAFRQDILEIILRIEELESKVNNQLSTYQSMTSQLNATINNETF